MLVSHTQYVWFVTVMTIGLAGGWIPVEILRLRRSLAEDRRDPFVRDRIFGSVIGIAICLVGLLGVVLYHF